MNFHLFFTLTLTLILFSCKNDPKRKVSPALQNSNVNLNDTETTEQADFKNEKSALLFNNYLAIKAAMVNTNNIAITTASKKLIANFNTNESYKKAHDVAVLIAYEKDIDKQREFFVGLTNEVTEILKSQISHGKVIQQFCPMAFNGKGGYWLSNSSEIRNPYFGNEMLSCGVVTKEFK